MAVMNQVFRDGEVRILVPEIGENHKNHLKITTSNFYG